MTETKSLFILKNDKPELFLISAKVNAKSVHSFLEDLFTHWAQMITMGLVIPPLELDSKIPKSERIRVKFSYNEHSSYLLRIEAAKNCSNLANYMEAIIHWLCEQHRKDGSVWIDDTPVKSLPIRMRK